jgi:hypothetical protein
MTLQCTFFWKWSTDLPEYVAQYSIWKPKPIHPSLIGKQYGPITYMVGDIDVVVQYRLAHAYRGLLRRRRPPIGFFTFELRRTLEGDWKILDVTKEHED